MMKSAMLQRQLRFQAVKIEELQSFIQECKENCGWAKNEGIEHMLEVWRKFLKDARKQMVKMDELQRFTKAELKEAYYVENFEKTYQHLGSFSLSGPPSSMSFSEYLNLIGDEI